MNKIITVVLYCFVFLLSITLPSFGNDEKDNSETDVFSYSNNCGSSTVVIII